MSRIVVFLKLIALITSTDAFMPFHAKETTSAREATINSRRESFGQIVGGALLPVAFTSSVDAADNYPYKVSTIYNILRERITDSQTLSRRFVFPKLLVRTRMLSRTQSWSKRSAQL